MQFRDGNRAVPLSRTESGGTEVKDNREKLHSVPE